MEISFKGLFNFEGIRLLLPTFCDDILCWYFIKDAIASYQNEIMNGVIQFETCDIWNSYNYSLFPTMLFNLCMSISKSSWYLKINFQQRLQKVDQVVLLLVHNYQEATYQLHINYSNRVDLHSPLFSFFHLLKRVCGQPIVTYFIFHDSYDIINKNGYIDNIALESPKLAIYTISSTIRITQAQDPDFS